MRDVIDDRADLEVSISRLQAEEFQIKELRDWLEKRLQETLLNFTHKIEQVGKDEKTFYEVTFRCDEPNRFKGDALANKLHEMLLVGWDINWTFVPGKRKTV
ncbi:hypothetical protein LCGC14_0185220 [marine sediment metagenome]|uniref:DUF695 domain-containing protein n=1 Tax=marine sediment metagenome TaxID=412755 RepID=A0A0F9X6W6_9ZZZZ|nr:hypothetical protein [Halomonas sp.]HDZ49284.1 hypothetical protein [Halomonas sp.]HEB05131.1 hypothetical protein [Halomonas sp.]